MVPVTTIGLPDLETAPPPEFDGPGGVWSPEAPLVASIAKGFILTFRGVSRAVKFEWEQVERQVDGVLERIAGVTQFTRFTTRATLRTKPGIDHARAPGLLERAEEVCLVANSLHGERLIEIDTVEEAAG